MEESLDLQLSIIVPVYNVEKYLRGCLDSLLMQTIDHDQMEVLLINDGSTDGSLDICREYDVTISLGDACRPGCIDDASEVQFVRLDALEEWGEYLLVDGFP